MGALQVKGIGLIGAVDVMLEDRARFEPHLSPELRKHLDDPPFAGDWYPVAHMLGVTEALRLGLFPEMDRHEAYALIGEAHVQREVFGLREMMTTEEARQAGGAFEGALKDDMDFATYVRRALALWQVYFDAGEQIGERGGERTLRVRLVGVRSPSDILCAVVSGVYRGVAAQYHLEPTAEHPQCSARGDAECVWLVHVGEKLDPSKLDVFGPWPAAT